MGLISGSCRTGTDGLRSDFVAKDADVHLKIDCITDEF